MLSALLLVSQVLLAALPMSPKHLLRRILVKARMRMGGHTICLEKLQSPQQTLVS